MKKNQFCNALKVLEIVKILLSIILFILVISFAIVGHCASVQDYFPMGQNDNNLFSASDIQYFDNACNTTDNYVFIKFFYSGTNNKYKNAYCLIFPKNANGRIYAEKNNDLIHFSLYTYGQPNSRIVHYQLNTTSGNWYLYRQYEGNGVSYFANSVSSKYSSTVSYISNYLVVTNNTSTAQIVLFYDDGTTIPDDDVAREDMEKPQISDYIPDWTNTPTFDNSSVENALQSVYNGVVWLGSNIKDTITGTGEYIADTVRWTVQKVINTIRNVFTAIENKVNDVKNSILTAVDKIQATIDYISQPYDSTKINTAFNNLTIKSDYNNLTTLVNNAFSVFDSTAEPNTFQIPIHLERIPILHVQTVQYIDLGWLYDCREIIRVFMWCLTTFGLLYTIIDSLPNYLSGNDE